MSGLSCGGAVPEKGGWELRGSASLVTERQQEKGKKIRNALLLRQAASHP